MYNNPQSNKILILMQFLDVVCLVREVLPALNVVATAKTPF